MSRLKTCTAKQKGSNMIRGILVLGNSFTRPVSISAANCVPSPKSPSSRWAASCKSSDYLIDYIAARRISALLARDGLHIPSTGHFRLTMQVCLQPWAWKRVRLAWIGSMGLSSIWSNGRFVPCRPSSDTIGLATSTSASSALQKSWKANVI